MRGEITGFLIDESRALDAGSLPADVLTVARQSILDWLGVTIAGACEPLVLKLLDECKLQGGHPLCTVVRHGERTSPAFAALINGAAADAADYSDVHLAMHGHPTAAVMAAALAAAEQRKASGAQLLAAVVAGIELECRVGLLIQPESYEQTGFHPTGPVVHFGATAAAAHLMGLDEAQWAHALGIAATQAAGLKASAGSMCKPTHCGFAAMHGVMAAGLAQRGFTSGQQALEGRTGFAATHTPKAHPDVVLASRGRFLILDTRVKRHAACALTHATIENMLQHRRNGIAAKDVKRIALRVPAGHLNVVGHREARTELEAKFSLWATSALALLGEEMGDFATYHDKNIHRAEVRALMGRVEVTEDPSVEFSVSHATLELADGRSVTATSDTSRPERDLALRGEHVQRKFHALADPVLGADRAAGLRDAVLGVERLASIQSLFKLSTGAAPCVPAHS